VKGEVEDSGGVRRMTVPRGGSIGEESNAWGDEEV
jgi:hypothetical protein